MKIIYAIFLFMVSLQAIAQAPVEKLQSTPMTQLEFGIFKLEAILSAKISEARNKWGLTSGVSYTKAQVAVASNTINVILYSAAPAKNLNLKSCNLGIMEFDSMLNLENTLSQIWQADRFGFTEKDLAKSVVIKLVITEASNSSLIFQCDWPITGDKIYQVK